MKSSNTINHIGIIADGNGRWAKQRGLPRSEGHRRGAEVVEKIIKYVSKNKLANYLSFYVFSTDNFSRSKDEVDFLMSLVVKWFHKFQKEANKYDIKVVFSSHLDYLKPEIVDVIKKVTESTKNNKGLVVNFCLSYDGKLEIVEATKKIAMMAANNEINVEDIDENLFNENLYQNLPPIDLLVRTSGEQRVSGFMLWQSSYAEFYFPKTYFPDFDEGELDEAILEYKNRDRRYGNVKE